jgi:hypothetical protein
MTTEWSHVLHRPVGKPDFEIGPLGIWIRSPLDGSGLGSGEWLDVLIQVTAAGAIVQAEGSILTLGELAAVVDGCRRLHETLSGGFEVETLEGRLRVALAIDGKGHVALAIELTPDLVLQRHRFEVVLDQSYLPATVRAGDETLRRFRGAAADVRPH